MKYDMMDRVNDLAIKKEIEHEQERKAKKKYEKEKNEIKYILIGFWLAFFIGGIWTAFR